MMRAVRALAAVSFLEAVRDRVLHTIILFAVLMFGVSHVVQSLVFTQRGKVVKDMGLGFLGLFGLFAAVFIGLSAFSRDVGTKRCFMTLSKPVQRGTYIVGKYAGALVTLGTVMALMGAVLMLGAAKAEGVFDPNIALGALFNWLELAVVVAAAFFFSVWMRPAFGGVVTLAYYVAGHLVGKVDDVLSWADFLWLRALRGVLWVVPNLEKFNLKAAISYHEIPSPDRLIGAFFYAVVYIAVSLILAWVVFRKKDMK